jgi:hypothetical protein
MSEPQASKANGAEPVPETPKAKNLVQKLCEVMAAVGTVAKKGTNTFHNYKYAKEADIVEAIRGELSQRNLFIFPHVTSHSRTDGITDIMVRWTFTDGDSGEERWCDIPGSGQDKGDKGVYKALTGSEKYFLMKSFLIPTGDDPEADSKDERENARSEAKKVGEAKVAAHRAKAAQSAPESQEQPPEKPIVLFSVALGDDVYEVSGDGYILQANQDILLKNGKKVKGVSGKAVVHMDAIALDTFKFEFEKRGGLLKALKPV